MVIQGTYESLAFCGILHSLLCFDIHRDFDISVKDAQ